MTSSRALAFIVALACVALGASEARAYDDARLRQAEQLAKKKERDAAMDLYRAVLDDAAATREDGVDVRYNLGTLCLETGDLGCAVLHLRAAARMDPSNDDVQHNLDVALESRVDKLAGSPVVDPVRTVGALVPPLVARLALAVPLALLGLALVLVAFAPSGSSGRLRSVARAFASIAAAGALVGGALYVSRRVVEGTAEAVVTVPETPALKEADTSSTVSFTAHAGLHGDVVARERTANGELLRVRFENGLEAWLKASDVAVLE